MKKTAILAVALGACLSSLAQGNETQTKENEFGISAQLRSRAEYRNGVLSPRDEGDKPAFFINERARLGFDYSRKNLQMKFGVQHVGVWGQDPQIDSKGRVVMHEAWAQLNTNDGRFFAKLGRQSLSYDGDRILGTLDWNVAGRWHDMLKLGYQNGVNQLHIILAINQNSERKIGGMFYDQSTAMLYKSMQGAWYHYKGSKLPIDASLLFLNIGYETGTQEKPHTSYLQTVGTKIDYGRSILNVSLEAYYQFGHKIKDVRACAYMLAMNANYRPTPRITTTLGIDYLSGSVNTSEKNTAFDPLYGTHHKYYGFMDYFYAQLWNQWGLINPHVSGDFKFNPRTSLQATYHYFATAADPGKVKQYEGLGRGLGSEIDLQLTYKVMKDVTLSAGYSTMFGSKTMDALKGGNHKSWQDWGWIQLNISPRIFSTKW